MKKTKEFVDKVYRLVGNKFPLSFMLATQHSRRFPLMYFDNETGVNKPLRYARNQKSPFVDEQDGNVILEPIVFEDGMLVVPKENQVLQEFLSIHPQNGGVFEEVDKGKEAAEDVETLYAEVDALILAREMTLTQLETIGRVLFGDINKLTTAELKRDMLVFARRHPSDLVNMVNDPMLKLYSKVQLFFDNKLLVYRNGKKDVHFNTTSNKKRMVSIPYGEDPIYIVSSFLQSDDGIEALKLLEKRLEDK
jgi:hypothetical protein|tara:strand:- start:512 stop:1261 length:750 start_codon:yes stop_codon:yes gene_type:complete